MPILAISSLAMRFASALSIHSRGQTPLVGSEPRKKFRHSDMSGTMARSWYTAAMPALSASRGFLKLTS